MKGTTLKGPYQQRTISTVSDSLNTAYEGKADKLFENYKAKVDSLNQAHSGEFKKLTDQMQQNTPPKEFNKQVEEYNKKSAAKMKKSPMKQAKPDYIDIDGDGNKTESMKKAAADKKSAMKQKKHPKDREYGPTDRTRKAAEERRKKKMEEEYTGKGSKPRGKRGTGLLPADLKKLSKTGSKYNKSDVTDPKKKSPAKMGHKSAAKMKKSPMKVAPLVAAGAKLVGKAVAGKVAGKVADKATGGDSAAKMKKSSMKMKKSPAKMGHKK